MAFQINEAESTDEYDPSSGMSTDDSDDDVPLVPPPAKVTRVAGPSAVAGPCAVVGPSAVAGPSGDAGPSAVAGLPGRGRGRGRGRGGPAVRGRARRQTRVEPADVTPVAGWRKSSDADPPNVPDFSMPSGMTTPLPAQSQPIEFFDQIFGADFFEKLAVTTNDNAAAKAPPAAGTSDVTSDPHWKVTDAAEMKAFVAINIMMGIIDASEYADYWSTEPILHNPFVSSIMSRGRYEKLCQFVHCSFAAQEDRADKLSKVRPLITLCQENFRRCYAPGRDLAVDEAMIAFDGRLAWKQYMPKKPVKWGMKIWCLCEATSGYCLAFTVYTGAETGVDAVTHDLGYRVVMKLMENYLNENRHVYADNYFTSVLLAKDLLAEDTYLCATTRAHRR